MKSASTNNIYQSTFMPIFEKASTKIKTLVLVGFLIGQPRLTLWYSILGIITATSIKIPGELTDKNAYVNGLLKSAEKMVVQYYDQPQRAFLKTREILLSTAPADHKLPPLDTPKQLNEFISDKRNLWAEAKGTPNVTNYPKELKKKIEELSEYPITTSEPGKKPITLWQKAELDTRYYDQMQKLQDLRTKGTELCWISSHPNCSKRCQAFQGELVSLTEHAKNPQKSVNKNFNYKKGSFVIRQQDGHKVYSLPDIMDVDGAYGYKNNIINGFNCRHRLIPYQKGTVAPTEYTEEEVKQQREVEEKIREMERTIRLYKTNEHLYNKSGDFQTAKFYRNKANKLTEQYKAFCERNGYAWYDYRLKIY